jgi:hypothetical protein
MYYCNICNYNSNLKSNLNRHLKSNKHMKNVSKSSASIQEVSDRYPIGIQKVSDRYPKGIQKVSDRYPIGIQKVSDRYPVTEKSISSHPFVCNLCHRQFTKKNNLYRHQKYRCKKKDLSNDSDNIIDLPQTNIENLNNTTNNNSNNTNNTNNTNTNTNQSYNNNSNNSITNILQINTFGNEDISFMTEEDKLAVLNSKRNAVPELIRIVNEQDSNKNFYIKNHKEKVGVIVNENNKFKHMNSDMIVDKLVKNNTSRLNKIFSELKDKIDPSVLEPIQHIIDTNLQQDAQELFMTVLKYQVMDYSEDNKKILLKIKD